MISHDRAFIDRVCSAIVAVEGKRLKIYRTNYDGFIAERERLLRGYPKALIAKAQGSRGSLATLFGPRVVIGVPTGVTNVQSRAVRDAARNAGAREALILEEPVAGAAQIRLDLVTRAG